MSERQLSKHERIRPRPPIESPIRFTTQALGLVTRPRALYSGQSTLSEIEQRREADAMAVANSQPHRRGVENHPDHVWKATALGRFVRDHWHSAEGQRDHWLVGERYAQLVDDERIARGLSPRQCSPAETGGETLTDEERRRRRIATSSALANADDVIREIGPTASRAIAAIRRLAWEDRDIPPSVEAMSAHGLYKLRVHFERLDRNARRRRLG